MLILMLTLTLGVNDAAKTNGFFPIVNVRVSDDAQCEHRLTLETCETIGFFVPISGVVML